MIKVNNLSKSFGNIQAVKNLSFSIDKGEVVGFLGPNGAGKTTTMRLLTGFLASDEGEIKIDQINVAQNPVLARQKIGYLPENNPLYPNMLVSEILNFFADLREIKNRKNAFDSVVSSTGIKEIYNRPFGELSKGFKQRVGLAQALLHEPEILILDEPTEGLDPNQRVEIRKLIRKIGEKRTVLLSTHVLQEVTAVCSRILIINKGEKIIDGSKDEILSHSQAGNHLELSIEGKEVVEKLKKLKEVKSILNVEKLDKIINLSLEVKENKELQPALMKVAHDNRWIIWKVVADEKSLEKVFYELTQDKEAEKS